MNGSFGSWRLKFARRGQVGLSAFLMLVFWVCLPGCVKVGPDYERPGMPFETPGGYQHTSHEESAWVDAGDEWWRIFDDPEICTLVDKIRQNNLDVLKAASQVLQLKAGFIQARADRFPALDLQVKGEKGAATSTSSKITGTSAGGFGFTINEERVETDSVSVSLPMTYELDLWGKLARATEAARADLLAAEENRRTVIQTMIAEALAKYFEIESLERQIAITRNTIENYQRYQDLIEARYDRGLTDVLTLRQARRSLAQAQAELPALEQNLGLAQQELAVLTGGYPFTTPERIQPEDYFHYLPPVPPGLPSDLLKRRPDVRGAEASLAAASARIGQAKAARFPAISLTATFGYQSDELSDLFTHKNDLWNIALGLVGPLFHGGKLKAAQNAAEAAYQEQLVDYAQIVLNAFAEVEAALLKRKKLLLRRERLLVFLEEARAAQKAAEYRFERGLTDYLNVLESQRNRYTAEENVVVVEQAILSNRVALHRALGGGWDEKTFGAGPAVPPASARTGMALPH